MAAVADHLDFMVAPMGCFVSDGTAAVAVRRAAAAEVTGTAAVAARVVEATVATVES